MARQDKFPVDGLSELEQVSDFEQCMGTNEGENHDISTPNFVESINVNLNARMVDKVDQESNMLVSGPNELKSTKLKFTWTRIMRMDYGLGGLPGVSEIPLLGKRGKSCEADNSSPQDVESVQHTKRGKLVMNSLKSDDGSAGVENHPCWKQ